MTKRLEFSLAAVALAGSLLLSACGGGGGDPSQSASIADADRASAPGLNKSAIPKTPTTPTTVAGISYPFGSHLTPYVAGIKPQSATQAEMDASVIKRYETWKRLDLRNACGNSLVDVGKDIQYSTDLTYSESIGYGMVILPLMAGYDPQARVYFDSMYQFSRKYPATYQSPDLMDWRVNKSCVADGGGWNAPDGDLDIAMGLLMAHAQWGSTGAINYQAEALKVIAALKKFNFTSNATRAWSMGAAHSQNHSRVSDYMLTHIRAFKRATGDVFWDKVIATELQTMQYIQAHHSATTGLLPDWAVDLNLDTPRPANPSEVEGGATDGDFFYNADRTPWRIASDYVMTGDAGSKAIASRFATFFKSEIAKRGAPSATFNPIQSGYHLDGTPVQAIKTDYHESAFTAPALVAGMVDASHQAYLDQMWTYEAGTEPNGYYGAEISLMSMIVASGNWWNP
jgi:endo-1,4-beta-D-glucanase Y